MLRNCLLGIVMAAAFGTAEADTLLLDGLDMSLQTAGQRPSRGQSMATVEARYGAPSSRGGAVGDPPISRWEYPGFTVFFEYDHVIHAVVNH
jgi:hypothetical protein